MLTDKKHDIADNTIRAKQVVEKRIKSNKVNNKKVQNKQDAKGNLNEKNERDGKNEQYDTRLSVKF